MNQIFEQLIEAYSLRDVVSFCGQYLLSFTIAILIFLVGRIAARGVTNILRKALIAQHVDQTLVTFSTNLLYAALMVFLVLASLGHLGIQTTGFLAVLGAAGLAIGMALQGSLSNFASGALIIMFRPFKLGDYIEGGGKEGTVEDIQIFTTALTTADNKVVIVPNGALANGVITNHSTNGRRRIDFVFSVNGTEDLLRVKGLFMEILEADKQVLKDPAPAVLVADITGGKLQLLVRPWVNNDQFAPTRHRLLETIKLRFDAEKIAIS